MTKTLTSSVPSPYRYRGFQRQPYQRSPDRAKSKLRRQRLGATSPLPPHLAAPLTPSQQAYARLLADEQLRAGDCRLCLDEIESALRLDIDAMMRTGAIESGAQVGGEMTFRLTAG